MEQTSRRNFLGKVAAAAALPFSIVSDSAEAAQHPSDKIESFTNHNGVVFKFPGQKIEKSEFYKYKHLFETKLPPIAISVMDNLDKKHLEVSSPTRVFKDEHEAIFYLTWNMYREAAHVGYDEKLGLRLQAINRRISSISSKDKNGESAKLEAQRSLIISEIKKQNLEHKNEIQAERLAIALSVLDRTMAKDKNNKVKAFRSEITLAILEKGQYSWVDHGAKFPSPHKTGTSTEEINFKFLTECYDLVLSFFKNDQTFSEIRKKLAEKIEILIGRKVPDEITIYERKEMTNVGNGHRVILGIEKSGTNRRLDNSKVLMEIGLLPNVVINRHNFRSHR